MQSGPKQLRDWMSRRGFNQAETAAFFGWLESELSNYLSGTRRPTLTKAALVEERTGIPARAWLSTDLDESENTVSATAPKSRLHKR